VTERVSNSLFLTVLPPRSLEGVGWTLRVLSERDYSSPVALVERFAGMGFTVEANGEGGGTVTLDSDDRVFSDPLPVGETAGLRDQEALWQVLEDGDVRFEFLAEDVDEDVVPASGGPRQTVIAGRGTGSVLEWAPVLPLGFPSPPATMTREFEDFPMVVWSQLFFEAQDAGYLGWVSLTFDDWGDSAGVQWAGTAQKLSVSAGDNLLDLLKRWCETNEFAWRMLPGWRLEVRQAAGVHHENEVVFTQWRSQGEHKRKISRRELANVVFADSGDNGLAFAEDGDSAAKWRKRFAWLSAGDAADASARSMIANSSLSLSKDQRLSRSVRIVPDREGRHPFVDFDLHDWIAVEVPDDETESGARKVLGLAVDIDAGGAVEYEATLQSRFEARAVKTQRILDKLGGSSRSGAGGKSSSPIPVSKAISAVQLADLTDVDLTAPAAGSLLQFSGGRWIDVGPNLDLLTDVDSGTIPGSGTVGLLYDRTAGLWKPEVLPAGGGGAVPVVTWPFASLSGTHTAYSSQDWIGHAFYMNATVRLTRIQAKMSLVAGATYEALVVELPLTSRVVSAIVGSVTFVAPAATSATLNDFPATTWTLQQGKRYGVLCRRVGARAAQYYGPGVTSLQTTMFAQYGSSTDDSLYFAAGNIVVGSTLPNLGVPAVYTVRLEP
jgi:hypothetical protein